MDVKGTGYSACGPIGLWSNRPVVQSQHPGHSWHMFGVVARIGKKKKEDLIFPIEQFLNVLIVSDSTTESGSCSM